MPGLKPPYATLTQLRNRFAIATADTSDDARLYAKLSAASAQIDRYTARTFAPVVATRLFDWRNARSILFRGEDLLQLVTLTNGDGNVIDPTAIIPLGGINGPIYALEVNVAKGPFLNYLTTRTRALSVSGLWGWHDDWLNTAWRNSGDSLAANVAISDSTITVTNASGADGWNGSPRFQVGQLIQIDNEYLLITAINTATNVLMVARGVNGTLATAHPIIQPVGTGLPPSLAYTIAIYSPPADLVEITLRYAAWLTRLEDAGEYGFTGGMTADGSAGGIHVPSAIPPDLLDELEPFRKISAAV